MKRFGYSMTPIRAVSDDMGFMDSDCSIGRDVKSGPIYCALSFRFAKTSLSDLFHLNSSLRYEMSEVRKGISI